MSRLTSTVVALVVAVSCGVPIEDHAQATPAEALPYGLGEPDSGTAADTDPGSGNGVVFLVADDRLRPVVRTVEPATDLNVLVAALTDAPSEREAASGLRRALPSRDLLGEVSRSANLATIELEPDFDELPPEEQILALAQLVYTLTELDLIDRVRFARDGEPLAIPTADGSLVERPVTRYDYRSLR